MLKKILLSLAILLLLSIVLLWLNGGSEVYALHQATSKSTVDQDYALQDDSKVDVPAQQPLAQQPYNALKNVYWGDLHVHTVESLDAVLFGNTLTIEDAYRFARGDTLRSDGGELMQLSRPLDFAAITDHAEGFGTRLRCGDEDLSLSERLHCWLMEEPNVVTFLLLAAAAGQASDGETAPGEAGVYQQLQRVKPDYITIPICALDDDEGQRCYADSNVDWARYVSLADKHNEPGVFTAFAAYEFSPALPQQGKHHRNVIFNGSQLPDHATSSLDVPNAIELWQALESQCTGDCDFFTIPHNTNKAWGLFYSPFTWDGKAYDKDSWQLRQKREPLAEIYQVKGASECALGVGAADEECGFSQILLPCEIGQKTECAFQTGFARQGLKIGLQLREELGFNPMAFGFVGSTDTHNASPGDAEEWDFVGKVASVSSPAVRRMREWPDRKPVESMLQFHTSGGLAAVWAQENTRDALFSGMQRREAYATSGTRITLRFFAGWNFDESVLESPDAIALATDGGVPMGANLQAPHRDATSPAFLVWAGADLMSAPLQRIQMVKGWIDSAGNTHEVVRDIACADGLDVDLQTQRCPGNGASVDLSDCSISAGSGAAELATVWRDPDYQPDQNAFYYVRVLQNPTCRWSTYDALRLGQEPPSHVPATIRERAWSSPIWVQPNASASAQSRAPLDLSVPVEVGVANDLTVVPDSAALPDLFAQKEKKESRLSGKLLVEEDEPLSAGAVKGAEVQLKIPLD
jgi:hypothetical protein